MSETLEQRLRAKRMVKYDGDGFITVPDPDCIEAADALAAMSCPPGWKMVPVGDSHSAYAAMLSASPTPPRCTAPNEISAGREGKP